ncbi:hypothetical protein AAFF_G00425600 [Aldrovandia affinis]|uniref:Uncharacterized protein n=1 Tax=Aldrovandia affinis TaxID=143900 RepID=A0AAD7T741_9TELE|nr:hypothetical protein AAFF_G00425600 [Aldrovandia affinis]
MSAMQPQSFTRQNSNESTAVFAQILSTVAVKDQTLEPWQNQDIFPAEEECSSPHPKDHAKPYKGIPIEEIQTGEIRLRDVEEQLPAQQDKEATQKGAPLTEEDCSVIISDEDGSSDKLCTVDCKKVYGSDMTDVSPSGHSGSSSQKASLKGIHSKVGVNEVVREDVKCAPLLFKTDFLSEKYFGENQPASIVTEEAHFGEGMYRQAFRTKLLVGLPSLFAPGHPCVLKVHNAICYGTKKNEELICKNYNLAVENIAREYIKAYTEEARSSAVFGEVPEIIPIYLVHRPSSSLPYATLEEELVGDFVKYSVRDGKEINLMRRDSEAGQKCCAFQHWVLHKTEGNLLVTDMQGVGMRLTDVGIATCTKGYRGFRGNCATSFIDQFKALHQLLLGFLLKVFSHSPTSIPRTSWKWQDVDLIEFYEPGVFNYSTLLLSEDNDVLYVGAREAIFQLSMKNVSVKKRKVIWRVPENNITMCTLKGKSKETDCLNYIRVLQVLNNDSLYVCGTHAFQPLCDYLSLKDFKLEQNQEDGRGKCPFDPDQSFATVMVDGELYSGTAYNFLGSEPIISRYSLSQGLLRTEYSTSWLNEPSFVFADIIRERDNSGEDDKIYFFFTEVSVEYEFFGKLLIPRIARVCKGDLGGQRTLQKKWTTFLKAKLLCSIPESNFVFNVVHDVFILKTSNWKESVIYGVFTSQWGNVGLSAVCAYKMLSVDEVFSKGKYMQKATVEQSHTKWVRYNGVTPSPRPGECITNNDRLQNISTSLHLPDKTLQFVKDHPLLEEPVHPIGNRPKLVSKDINYTQIVVDRIQALNRRVYEVIFTGTDKGFLHKSIVYEGEVHTIEEIQLFPNSEPIKTLVLSSQGVGFLYAGSDNRIVQSPKAFCEKYHTCENCILARDPFCAWDPESQACYNILQVQRNTQRNSIQSLSGDADRCPKGETLSTEDYQHISVKLGCSAELPCQLGSNLEQAVWRMNSRGLAEASSLHLQGKDSLLIYSVGPKDQGRYECWSLERAGAKNFTRLVRAYVLSLDSASPVPASPIDSSSLHAQNISTVTSSSSSLSISSYSSTELWTGAEFWGIQMALVNERVWRLQVKRAFILFSLTVAEWLCPLHMSVAVLCIIHAVCL